MWELRETEGNPYVFVEHVSDPATFTLRSVDQSCSVIRDPLG